MADPQHPLSGRVSHALIFRCATCPAYYLAEGPGGRIAGDQAERKVIRAGWVRGRAGWRCPKCLDGQKRKLATPFVQDAPAQEARPHD